MMPSLSARIDRVLDLYNEGAFTLLEMAALIKHLQNEDAGAPSFSSKANLHHS